MTGDPWDLLPVVGPSIEGEPVQGVVDWVMVYCSPNGIYLVGGQLKVSNDVVDFNGKGIFVRQEVADMAMEYHLLVWIILYSITVFLHANEHALQLGMCGMDRSVLDHLMGLWSFWTITCLLYRKVWNFSRLKYTGRYSFSVFA